MLRLHSEIDLSVTDTFYRFPADILEIYRKQSHVARGSIVSEPNIILSNGFILKLYIMYFIEREVYQI